MWRGREARGAGRIKRLNAQLKEQPELFKQRFTERIERARAASVRGLEKAEARQYAAAIADFGEMEDCAPAAVIDSPLCRQIARRFNKSPEQVASDIKRQHHSDDEPQQPGLFDKKN
jgi:hypothetical protein